MKTKDRHKRSKQKIKTKDQNKRSKQKIKTKDRHKRSNKRSKHIRIHNSYIWEQIHIFKRIKIGKVATEYNVADLQTKPLKADLFNYHTKTLMGERHSFKDFSKKTVNYTEFKISDYMDGA